MALTTPRPRTSLGAAPQPRKAPCCRTCILPMKGNDHKACNAAKHLHVELVVDVVDPVEKLSSQVDGLSVETRVKFTSKPRRSTGHTAPPKQVQTPLLDAQSDAAEKKKAAKGRRSSMVKRSETLESVHAEMLSSLLDGNTKTPFASGVEKGRTDIALIPHVVVQSPTETFEPVPERVEPTPGYLHPGYTSPKKTSRGVQRTSSIAGSELSRERFVKQHSTELTIMIFRLWLKDISSVQLKAQKAGFYAGVFEDTREGAGEGMGFLIVGQNPREVTRITNLRGGGTVRAVAGGALLGAAAVWTRLAFA